MVLRGTFRLSRVSRGTRLSLVSRGVGRLLRVAVQDSGESVARDRWNGDCVEESPLETVGTSSEGSDAQVTNVSSAKVAEMLEVSET